MKITCLPYFRLRRVSMFDSTSLTAFSACAVLVVTSWIITFCIVLQINITNNISFENFVINHRFLYSALICNVLHSAFLVSTVFFWYGPVLISAQRFIKCTLRFFNLINSSVNFRFSASRSSTSR